MDMEERLKNLEENFEDMRYDNVLRDEQMIEILKYITGVDLEYLPRTLTSIRKRIEKLEQSKLYNKNYKYK